MAKRVPTAFGGDILLWTAWLYHVEKLTQGDIAEELEISRQTVANYLNEALNKGLVQISLHEDILARQSLSAEMCERFGLEAVHLVPTPKSDKSLLDRLGKAGSLVLQNLTGDGDTIGVAFGRTVFRLGQQMASSARSKCRVVQVAGSSIGGESAAPEVCALLIANKISARCFNLFAPAFLTNDELAGNLLNEPSLKEQFAMFEETDIVVFGVGELNMSVNFSISGTHFLSDEIKNYYLESGAKAVIFGRFIDADGNEMEGPLKNRTIAIDLDTVKKCRKRLIVSGGKEKIEAMLATLNARYGTHLVTDEKTAKRILKLSERAVELN